MSNKIVPLTYRAIIDDVMHGIRHEFDEYGIDESVLADLQQRWESKVIASNVADFESGGPSIPPLAPPPMYAAAPQMPHYPGYQAPPMPAHHYPPMPQQPPAQTGHPIKAEPTDRFPLIMPPQYMAHQQTANGQGHFVLPRNAPAGVPHAAGGVVNAAARFTTPAAAPEIPPLPSLPQLDGAASDDDDDDDSPPPNHAPRTSHPSLPPPIPPLPGLGGIPPLPMLNGIPPLPSFHQAPTPGPAPSIPPLPNLGGAVAGEEINSDLDDSDSDVGDDPDESAGPETDIVFCTYDKVQRVKSKWKCVLKDGMVHVNGKDYLFARCNCEFEW